MGNLVSILSATRPGQEVICEGRGHIYNYEMASMASVGGVLPRVIETKDGILSWEQIEGAIRPSEYYRAQTAMVSLENTHNMAGGTVYPTAVVSEICRESHARGLHVHLDGARIFNAAVSLGENVRTITRDFDSVQFCLSKGLGAPVGSVVVASREFVERCRRYRKMLGGGMRQAGVLAAAGLVALERGPGRLHVDHENARFLAETLGQIPILDIDPGHVPTNIVIFSIRAPGVSSGMFLEALRKRGVLAVAVDPTRVRMVTHLDVSREDVKLAAEAAQEVAKEMLQ
jgi:threonine aldolase